MDDEYEPFQIHLRYCILERNHQKERFVIAVQDTTDDAMLIYEEVDPDTYIIKVVSYYVLFLHALTKEQAIQILDDMKEDKRASARSKLRRFFNNHTFITDGQTDSRIILDDLIPDDWYDSWKEMESTTVRYDAPAYFERNVRVSDERG